MNRRGFFKVLAGCVPAALFVGMSMRGPSRRVAVEKLAESMWDRQWNDMANTMLLAGEKAANPPLAPWPRDHVLVFSSGP